MIGYMVRSQDFDFNDEYHSANGGYHYHSTVWLDKSKAEAVLEEESIRHAADVANEPGTWSYDTGGTLDDVEDLDLRRMYQIFYPRRRVPMEREELVSALYEARGDGIHPKDLLWLTEKWGWLFGNWQIVTVEIEGDV